MSTQDRLLSDDGLRAEIANILLLDRQTMEPYVSVVDDLINLVNTQKRLYAESEKLKELNRVHFEAMANSRENLLERILQRMKFCEEELGSAESED